jgi:hypothetical protein
MLNALEQLAGVRVTDAHEVHDYIQIKFGEGAGLRVFNEYIISGAKSPTELQGRLLLEAAESETEVTLKFDAGIVLAVSLLPHAYHGPEAMVLNRENKPIVVWN